MQEGNLSFYERIVLAGAAVPIITPSRHIHAHSGQPHITPSP